MARRSKTREGIPTPEETVTAAPKRPPIDTGAASAGQSGDLQGLSELEDVDSESVSELIEEGQFYEASVVSAVENAPDPDAGPLRPRRRSEDNDSSEYVDLPPDEPIE